MVSTDTIDDSEYEQFLLLREYSFYLLRYCFILYVKKNPDLYDLSSWERKSRFLILTDDDCCEVRDSEIEKCCYLPDQFVRDLIEVLMDRCKGVVNCTSKENATHPSGSSWPTDYLIRNASQYLIDCSKENATTLIGSPCATDYTIPTTSAYLILVIILIATIIMMIVFFFFLCKNKRLNNGFLYMSQCTDEPKCLTSEPKDFY